MAGKLRTYLYLIVTDYPFGNGEPFLETELFAIASCYKHVYIVIPESHRVNQQVKRYKLPQNATLILLETKATLKDKLRAGLRWLHPSFKEEIKHIAIFRALQLGDMLCIIPAIRALKNRYPDAYFTNRFALGAKFC